LKKINRSGLLPGGVILTGGGAKLPLLVELAKEKLKLPVFLGLPLGLEESPIDKINDPSYATAVGLALWGSQSAIKTRRVNLPSFPSIDHVVSKMKDWFKSLMP